MIAYLSGDLIDSTACWTPQAIEKFAHELADRFVGKARVTAMALSQGDSFQLETKGEEALSIAMLLDALARRDKRPGMRVAFALQENTQTELPISVRSGPAYVAAGRGIVELKRLKQRIGLFGGDGGESGWTSVVMLCSTLTDGHTERQSEIFATLLSEPNIDQRTIAKRLGVTQQTISQHYSAGRMAPLLSADTAFRAYALAKSTNR